MANTNLITMGMAACFGGMITSIVYDGLDTHYFVLSKLKSSLPRSMFSYLHTLANVVRFLCLFLGFTSGGFFEYRFKPIIKFLLFTTSVVHVFH